MGHLDKRVGNHIVWRREAKTALEAQLDRLFSVDSDIQSLWDAAQRVPVANRRQWFEGDEGETHRADIETELHWLTGTNDEANPPPRLMNVTAKPKRGTRKGIIAEIARQFGMTESAVDNLWQAYRRFERELQDSAET